MILLTLYLVCVFVALGVGVLACWSDFKGLMIPNLYSVLVLGSFGVCYLALYLGGQTEVFEHFGSHLIAALLVFGVTLVMFLLKALGAADSKLGTAYALWLGLPGLMPFLFYMALTGGLLGVAALFLRKYKIFKAPAAGSWIERVQQGESKVPYGIAIFVGALASFAEMSYLSPEVLSAFLSS